MFRLLAIIALVAATFGVMNATASAGNPHFVNGPDCSLSNNTLTCAGKVAGLGNSPIFVVLYAPAGCTTPSGSNNPPGQARFITGPFPTNNGQFTFGPGTGNNVTAQAPNCPGNQTGFIGQGSVTVQVWECTSGPPRFNNKTGAQTNSSCTLAASGTDTI